MIRPWYQSLVFWLGIPLLGFIVWLWTYSMRVDHRWERWVSAKGPPFAQTTQDVITHSRSRVLISWCRFDPMPGRSIEHHPFTRIRAEVRDTATWFPAFGLSSGRPDPGQVRHSLSIPHWFIIAMYLLLWYLAYRLRCRWVRRRYADLQRAEWTARNHAALAAGEEPPPPPADPRATREKIFRREED